jgi:DNA-directed RNA polymerase
MSVFEVDQLELLLHQLSENNPEINFPDIPAYGNADISEVLDSKYFFS